MKDNLISKASLYHVTGSDGSPGVLVHVITLRGADMAYEYSLHSYLYILQKSTFNLTLLI